MRHPATLLPAGEGRRGDLLPAPSPDIFSAHTPVERKLTGVVSVSPARVCSLARATSPACGPGLSLTLQLWRHECLKESTPLLTSSVKPRSAPIRSSGFSTTLTSLRSCNRRRSRSVGLHAGLSTEPLATPSAPSRCESFSKRRTQLCEPVCRDMTAPGASASGLSPRSPAGAPDRSVFSHRCGGVGCVLLSAALPGRARPQSKPVSRFDRPALTSSALTADPRRADPGNLLAGAVAARLRPYHWPVALRGGGHIAEVV